MNLYEELAQKDALQKAKIEGAKIILDRRKMNVDKQLEKVKENNSEKEERLRLAIEKINADKEKLSMRNKSISAMIPTNEEAAQSYSNSFFSGEAGEVLDYLINKRVVAPRIRELANILKKDNEFLSLIPKIKNQLDSKEPNPNLLTVLKSKINTRIKNYKEGI